LPWDDAYYALASAFLNGRPVGTTTPTTSDPGVPDCPPPPTETTTTVTTPPETAPPTPAPVTRIVVRRPSYYVTVGPFGVRPYWFDKNRVVPRGRVGAYKAVAVYCKVVHDSRTTSWITARAYWYQLASSPWALLYAPADAFLNGDPVGGPFHTHVARVIPNCPT
jgi:hypothetical protein